jgi:hypothetical protein
MARRWDKVSSAISIAPARFIGPGCGDVRPLPTGEDGWQRGGRAYNGGRLTDHFIRRLAMRKSLWCVAAVMVCALWTDVAAAQEEKPKNRCFEMRTYTAHDGKLDALNARFRNHTNRLFEKHGMTLVGFWVPEGDRSKDTLIYILAFPDKEARAKSFKAFGEDEEWKKARDESEKGGKIVKKIESVFLNPTDYSPMK